MVSVPHRQPPVEPWPASVARAVSGLHRLQRAFRRPEGAATVALVLRHRRRAAVSAGAESESESRHLPEMTEQKSPIREPERECSDAVSPVNMKAGRHSTGLTQRYTGFVSLDLSPMY